MPARGVLVLGALALLCSLALSSDVDFKERPWLRRGPPRAIRRPPPKRSSTPAPAEPVSVTVLVSGEVAIGVSHQENHDDEAGFDALDFPPAPDVSYSLGAPLNASSQDSQATAAVKIPLDFGGERPDIVTGQLLSDVPISLELPAEVAEQLDLGSGLAAANTTGTRRRLSEDQHELRRAMLEFHGTRRSLGEVRRVLDLINAVQSKGLQGAFFETKATAQGTGNKAGYGGVKDLFVVGGQKVQVSSLVFLMHAPSCGRQLALSASQFADGFFANPSTGFASVERYHTVCSWGKFTYPPRVTNRVYGPIDIGACRGSERSMGSFDVSSQCGDREFSALMDKAKAWLSRTEPDTFRRWKEFRRIHIVFPLADTPECGFGGIADVGCPGGQDCFSLVNLRPTAPGVQPVLNMHELVHNIGLAHSGRRVCDSSGRCAVDEYGDPTCIMGRGIPTRTTASYVCLNAPQAYKGGWANAIEEIDYRLSGQTEKTYQLPSMATTDRNFIRIVLAPTRTQVNLGGGTVKWKQAAFFVSYRAKQPGKEYDNGLNADYDQRVYVHFWDETQDAVSSELGNPPQLWQVLDVPVNGRAPVMSAGTESRYRFGALPNVFEYRDPRDPRARTIVRIKSKTLDKAEVSVCYTALTRESDGGDEACTDGKDNDCDGLADDEDPDCPDSAAVQRRSPPPPPPSRTFKRPPPPSPPPPPKKKWNRGH
ncbi:hypothetical protein HYH03_001858 [Edaphochlamys debaryana]|uniref:Peptidase M11 gametolysin domain-containing protein n=1 Tax=Edaphochlamys debaryana TaxID=47281 RepID=A0A835YC97_9CHLO|nr:hypothetical protein HYH03_001858 [Edaphochlamys debaryana]|eukprot:KAG2500280.1 hypothetical protein HYH03_001858 [Edaphochlamys debaryana]